MAVPAVSPAASMAGVTMVDAAPRGQPVHPAVSQKSRVEHAVRDQIADAAKGDVESCVGVGGGSGGENVSENRVENRRGKPGDELGKHLLEHVSPHAPKRLKTDR